MNFLKNRTIFELEDKLLPVIQHGFLRSEENVVLINFEHLKSMGNYVSCTFCGHLCLVVEFMADVMPLYYIGRCYALGDVVPI